MARKQASNRTEFTYLVACDCEVCLEKCSPYGFMTLSDYLPTKAKAIKEQKKYLSQHPQCYLATHFIEPIPLPYQKLKTRKAA
ncbi:MAG: hypothetical protein NPIRA03_06810 [Nitrospirales bacterium]|nr:MAG: hypothetical protein NPIRA03_06810 [Nitrospirales bacterium]